MIARREPGSHRCLFWVAALPLLLVAAEGCSFFDSGWTLRSRLPENFFATSTLGLSSTAALFAGYLQGGPSWKIEDRSAAVFRWEEADPQRVYTGSGWIECASNASETVWAIAAVLRPDRDGSLYRALLSTDGGRTFEERGAVPVRSVEEVIAISASEAWVLGANSLARTKDGGRSWQEVPAPGTRDPTREHLGSVEGHLVLAGDGALLTSDGGATWSRIVARSLNISAIDGSSIAEVLGPRTRVGRMGPGGPEWIASVEMKGARPFRLAVDGQHIRIAAQFQDARAERCIMFFESTDYGKRWKSACLAGTTTPGAIAFGPLGSGFAVDTDGRVRHRAVERLHR